MASRTRLRVFLDTNVIYSGLHSPHGFPNRILEAAATGTIRVVVSPAVLLELTRNIQRKAPHLLGPLREFLTMDLEIAPEASNEETERWLAADLGTDAAIVASAEAAEVDYFCTGDRRLLHPEGGWLGSLRVVSPADLLRLLEQEAR